MPSSVSSLIDLEAPLDFSKALRKIEVEHAALKSSIFGIDDDRDRNEALGGLSDFYDSVDDAVTVMIANTDVAKALYRDAKSVIDSMEELLSLIPNHVVVNDFDSGRITEWANTHANGNVDVVLFPNGKIIVFEDRNDHTLFRITYGV